MTGKHVVSSCLVLKSNLFAMFLICFFFCDLLGHILYSYFLLFVFFLMKLWVLFSKFIYSLCNIFLFGVCIALCLSSVDTDIFYLCFIKLIYIFCYSFWLHFNDLKEFTSREDKIHSYFFSFSFFLHFTIFNLSFSFSPLLPWKYWLPVCMSSTSAFLRGSLESPPQWEGADFREQSWGQRRRQLSVSLSQPPWPSGTDLKAAVRPTSAQPLHFPPDLTNRSLDT